MGEKKKKNMSPKRTNSFVSGTLAQKTRFELVLRLSHTTPLAGEPLEPLGYFCKPYNYIIFFSDCQRFFKEK